MSTRFSQRWQSGLQRLMVAETEQGALAQFVSLCSELTSTPVVGVLESRAGLLQAVSAEPAPDAATRDALLARAVRWIREFERQDASGSSAPELPQHTLLPLNSSGDLLGVLVFAGADPIEPRYVKNIDTIIVLCTQTLRKLRWQAEVQLLSEMSVALGTLSEPADLLQQIIARITSIFRLSISRIFLLDERAGDLVITRSTVDTSNDDMRLPINGTIAGTVVQNEQSLICNNGTHGRVVATAYETGVEGGHVICVPLCFSGRVFGALMLANPLEGPQFGEEDRRLLTTVAGTVAALIANARLYVRAVRDALTGAYNRGAFNSTLEQNWARVNHDGSGFALILLDLDNFKYINDRFGHSIGDQVLQSVTQILWEALRSDDSIFRYGGEEFCVLLAGVTEATTALAIAERLRGALDRSLLINRLVRVPISASLGVAIYPLHKAKNPRDLLDIADDAAYQAKRDGKNRVVLAAIPEARPVA